MLTNSAFPRPSQSLRYYAFNRFGPIHEMNVGSPQLAAETPVQLDQGPVVAAQLTNLDSQDEKFDDAVEIPTRKIGDYGNRRGIIGYGQARRSRSMCKQGAEVEGMDRFSESGGRFH